MHDTTPSVLVESRLHVRGRLAFGRSSILAVILAALTLILVGSSAALAAGGATQTPARPTPRAQLPGDPVGYRLPFAAGLEVPIEQGWNSHYSHKGRAAYAYDFGLYVGTPVLAAASGVVSYTHSGETKCGGADLLLHANYVTIDHPDGSATQYGHLSAVDVKVGEVVTVGQQIGLSGRTGYTGCMPHLHFARQAQGGPVTQSVPVYFEGIPDRELVDGEVMTAPAPACGPTDADLPTGAFCGTYSTRGSAAAPLFSRLEKAINFDWTAAAPGGYWLDHPVDGFAARWSGRVTVSSDATFAIRVVASDRVRVSIDGQAVLEDWTDQGFTRELIRQRNLTEGVHRIDVEVDDADGKGSLMVDVEQVLGEGEASWVSRYERLAK